MTLYRHGAFVLDMALRSCSYQYLRILVEGHIGSRPTRAGTAPICTSSELLRVRECSLDLSLADFCSTFFSSNKGNKYSSSLSTSILVRSSFQSRFIYSNFPIKVNSKCFLSCDSPVSRHELGCKCSLTHPNSKL